MTTYAESIQKPDAAIYQGTCSLPLERCVSHIECRLQARDFRRHEVYARDGRTVVDARSRDSMSIRPGHDEELAFFVFEAVRQYFEQHFLAKPSDSLVLAQHEFFAYLPGAGLRLHADDHVLKPDGSVLTRDLQRGITAILYLNSSFEGGELRFPEQGLALCPSAGMLVIFPSNRNFPHEVKPILRGRRYSYQRIYGVLDGRTGSFEV